MNYPDIIVIPAVNILDTFESNIFSPRGNLLLTADDPKSGFFVKENIGIGVCNLAAISRFKIVTLES